MNAYKVIEKSTWPRAETFDFFTSFADPCIDITVPVEAQQIYAYAKDTQKSFFTVVLYAILRAANAVPQCRQRMLGEDIIEFERIAAMTPIISPGDIFRQIWCEYTPTLPAFINATQDMIAAAQKDTSEPLGPRGEDFICASCNPWYHFSSMVQAKLSFGQAVPILAWGKFKNNTIPIGCKFNHMFMDGVHVGHFFTHIEESFAKPEGLEKAAMPRHDEPEML